MTFWQFFNETAIFFDACFKSLIFNILRPLRKPFAPFALKNNCKKIFPHHFGTVIAYLSVENRKFKSKNI